MYGYHNRIARVNLTEGKVTYEELPDEVIRKFIGGKGLGYYLIYREVPPGTDPLSPANKFVFAPGGMTGLVPGSSKVIAVSKSPETGLITDSSGGDAFGPKLKGHFDALILEGKSEEPVYLYIHDGKVEILPASRLWGKGNYDVAKEIWREHPGTSMAMIGPAGEKLSRIANVVYDTERASGRGGLGAVLGSKKVKAVVVEPGERPEVANPEEFQRLWQEYYNEFATNPKYEHTRNYGTTDAMRDSASVGMSPAYNFSRPHIPDELASKLAGDEVKKYEVEPEWFVHGKSCPIKCARYVEVEYKGRKIRVKPEYESIAMLGAATGVFNFPAVAYFNWLVNNLGLDSIATGNTIAWLFEMVERGLIGEEEIGFPVKGFGDEEAEEKLIKLMAERKGIGAVLADGVKRACERLGRGCELAVHVKGLESPAWDPRGRRTYALSYATADVGASHLRGWPRPHQLPNQGPAKELVPSLIEDRDESYITDMLGTCKFVPYELEDLARLYSIVTGEEWTVDELRRRAWAVESMARIHNALDWVVPPLDDTIPPRWWEPEPDGPAEGNKAFIDYNDFLEARREFYRLRGWDEELGVPLPETMEKLGLPEFKEDAERALEVVRKRLGL
ncbi:aldehyde ferredoxin oxidoreductase family protein [Thermococcus waiotapuensis]|uniref:Aldehyde ferredoxin oxidoreductase family protein n=1 Tax=Thermococcus waiotapuensis TaxID=90909 RepID=A0AAE4NVU5_9EURY|nr:aldehyde ferredoxin oxidoreductase family protein [Thermococcus waiotapuensis]MDV3104515.1 aldehyde ferredoxin oxidoreductase family protein [Thermococcus waiotapuensis]